MSVHDLAPGTSSFAPEVVAFAMEPDVVADVAVATRAFVERLSVVEYREYIERRSAPSTERQRRAAWNVPAAAMVSLCQRCSRFVGAGDSAARAALDELRAAAEGRTEVEVPALAMSMLLPILRRAEHVSKFESGVAALYRELLVESLRSLSDGTQLDPTWRDLDGPPSVLSDMLGRPNICAEGFGVRKLLEMGMSGVPYDFGTACLHLPRLGRPLVDPSWTPHPTLQSSWPPRDLYRMNEGTGANAIDVGWRVAAPSQALTLAQRASTSSADTTWWDDTDWYLRNDGDLQRWDFYRDRFVAHCRDAASRGLAVVWNITIPCDQDRPM